jgi:hypothetical protein
VLAPGEYALVLVGGDTRRKAFTNAHHAGEVKAAEKVPLEHVEVADQASLTAGLARAGEALTLELAFGPHRWTAPLRTAD